MIVLVSQFYNHLQGLTSKRPFSILRFQPGKGPSRSILRDCENFAVLLECWQGGVALLRLPPRLLQLPQPCDAAGLLRGHGRVRGGQPHLPPPGPLHQHRGQLQL